VSPSRATLHKSVDWNSWWTVIQPMRNNSRMNWGWSKIDVLRSIRVINVRNALKLSLVKNSICFLVCMGSIVLACKLQLAPIHHLMLKSYRLLKPWPKTSTLCKRELLKRSRIKSKSRIILEDFPLWMLLTFGIQKKKKREALSQ